MVEPNTFHGEEPSVLSVAETHRGSRGVVSLRPWRPGCVDESAVLSRLAIALQKMEMAHITN